MVRERGESDMSPQIDILYKRHGAKGVADVLNPSTQVQPVRDRACLLSLPWDKLEDEQGNVSGRATIDPGLRPKAARVAIANGPSGGSTEDVARLRIAGEV